VSGALRGHDSDATRPKTTDGLMKVSGGQNINGSAFFWAALWPRQQD